MPRLSLCMIVRDEREQLDACLDAAGAFVDEMVIGDTGSRDGTLARARARADRVLALAWNDDFAEARNRVLDAARGDFVLSLDADERLHGDAAALHRRLGAGLLAARVEIRSDVGAGEPECFRAVRLFRRDPALRFSGRVHEQLTPALEAWLLGGRGGEVARLDEVWIEHLGYRPECLRARRKPERNARLLRRALEETPEAPYLLYKLFQALASAGQAPAAADALERCAKRLLACAPAARAREAIAAEALTAAAQQRLAGGAVRAALAASQAALALGEHPAARLVHGQVLLVAGDCEAARRSLRRALETPAPPEGFGFDAQAHDAGGRFLLAEAERRAGRTHAALATLADAIRRHPSDARLAGAWRSAARATPEG